jgi:hypothetical protein
MQLKIATAIIKKARKALKSENTSCNIDTRKLKVSKIRKKKFNFTKNKRMIRHFTIFI